MTPGSVYGVALNDRLQLDGRDADFRRPPYGAPPRAPVLYIKPRNCFGHGGAPVPVPAGLGELEAAPTLALLVARDLCQAEPAAVRAALGGACLALDVCEPHESYYRPAIRERCRDGFLPLGAFGPAPQGAAEIVTKVDGREAHRWSLDRLVRPIETLCAEISQFMTLQAGDLLLVGLPGDAPRVRAGQTVTVESRGLPTLTAPFAPEAGPMKRARIAHEGRPVWAEVVADGARLRLPDGRELAAEGAVWLPPIERGATVFALGLNYADHSAELGFKPPTTPLVFLKAGATFTGHGGTTPMPPDARQIHPECELVAIIGKPAKHVPREEALDYVSGYTVANDYAVREYLENYCRPNLKVKNRDGATPLGPWVVDAADLGDPQSLSLETRVNGAVVQSGSTADMIFDIAGLIAHLSGFMTLLPGDMILTGTPTGVHFVEPGDEVVCEIEKVGRLINRIGGGR